MTMLGTVNNNRCPISPGSLDSAMAEVMREQNKRTSDVLKAAEDTILDSYDRLRQQANEHRQAIARRRRAQKSKSFWRGLVGFFKTVWDYGAAAVSACTGGAAGAIGGLLMLTSLVVGKACRSDAGKWTSFALNAGGCVLAGFASKGTISDPDGELEKEALRAVSAGTGVPAAGAEKDRLRAEADLQGIRAEKKRLWQRQEAEREALRDQVESESRSAGIVVKILDSSTSADSRVIV